MKRYPGVVTGIVKSLADPQGQGRIEVQFPWLSDSLRSAWAPVAAPLAGRNRGQFFMPEVDDEVLVAFEHGDFDHPFVIGFLWNGVDTPPETTNQNRIIKTPGGHQLRFEDRDGAKKVIIKSAGGHEVELSDVPPASIKIRTTAGNQIEISDAPPTINITTQTGTVNINCSAATIAARSLLRCTAPIAQFSGTVIASTVVATAVVGSSYTPAPGNTFGM